MKILKVLQINCSSYGSTGNLAKSIHQALLSQGHESRIYYGIGKSDQELIKPVGSMIDVHIHSVLSRYTGMQGYFSHIPTLRLISKIKKFNPDIIHLHNLHGSYINLPILFRFFKKYKKKTVITLHDCWLFTGKCPHFTDINCEKWLDKCGKCPQLQIYPRSKFIDRTRQNLSDKKKWFENFPNLQIVTVSEWLKDVASKSFLSEYPIKCIYNGIDTDIFYPRDTENIKNKYNLNGKFVILGVASFWDKRKGLDKFIKLAADHPDDVVILVGLNKEQAESVPENVIAIPRTESKEELAEIYSVADVFVNLSTEETFGLVVAEAMACGTPAIVYNSTACPEIVSKETGFVAEPDNIDQIYDFIEKLRKENKDYSDVCSRYIQGNFIIKHMLDAYEELYNEHNARFNRKKK